MPEIRNRIAVETATTGTGTVTIGATSAQYFAPVAGDDGVEFEYILVDADGADVEIGVGTYTHSGTTFSRTSVQRSTNGDALVSLSSGTHSLYLSPSALSLERALLKYSAHTLTAAGVTGVVNTHHVCTIAGLTASRNALFTAGAAGDRKRFSVIDGDDTYALIVIGDTGITLNGGAAATELTRMFRAGEYVEGVATSATNWQVEIGTLPTKAKMSDSGSPADDAATGSALLVELDTEDKAEGITCDTATGKMTVRRAGEYDWFGHVTLIDLDDGKYASIVPYVNGAQAAQCVPIGVFSSIANGDPDINSAMPLTLAAADYVQMYVEHDNGTTLNLGDAAANYARMSLMERP